MKAKQNSRTKKAESSSPQNEACPFCKEGILAASPSGRHLVCQKCGRIVLRAKAKQTEK